MNEKLTGYIDELGGKHGALAYLREQPDGERYIPASEVLKTEDALTWATWQNVLAACRDMKSDKVIIRTSQAADWSGMVDTMPTVVTEASQWGYLHARWVVSRVRRQCKDSSLTAYSQAEGTGYDPDRVTVSLAPHLSGTQYTLTEHPNQEGVVLADSLEFSGSTGSEFHTNGHFVEGEPPRNSFSVFYQSLDHLRQWLRGLDCFDEGTALQLEQGLGPSERPFLFQVKDFASREKADFVLSDQTPGILDQGLASERNFGVTPPEGLVLPRTPLQVGREGMREISASRPFIYWLLRNSHKLKITDYNPEMRGYVVHYGNAALSHQNTRFVQACLRRDGVARVTPGNSESASIFVEEGKLRDRVVSSTFPGESLSDRHQEPMVRIISDGYRWAVQPA